MPEIRFGVAEPDLDIANVETAIEGLAASCYYLSSDQNRYRFSLSPNLNKILIDRRGSRSVAPIDADDDPVIFAKDLRRGAANATCDAGDDDNAPHRCTSFNPISRFLIEFSCT